MRLFNYIYRGSFAITVLLKSSASVLSNQLDNS